jgi:hypothetical protein
MASWNDDLEAWLEPFVRALGHKARRQMCPACIAGLIGPGALPTHFSREGYLWFWRASRPTGTLHCGGGAACLWYSN